MIDLTIAGVCLGGGIYLGMKYGDSILKWWLGAEAFANAAKAKADAAIAAVKKI